MADHSLGKAGDGKGRQATAAQSAGATTDVPDETKSKTAVATAVKTVPSKTTDTSGDKSSDSTPSSNKAGTTQAQKTTQEEVVANSEPNKDPILASTAAVVPADITPPPPVPTKAPTPENDATVTKQNPPTSEPAASAEPNGEVEVSNAPDADAKKASETQAQTVAPSVKQGNGEKPDMSATEPALQPSQNGEAGSENPTSAKVDDTKSAGPTKPTLRLDHVREISTSSTMSASSPGTPADEAQSSAIERDDDADASGAKLSKTQKKRMREKASKARKAQQTQKGEKNSPRPSSGAASNNVDNSVVQEPKPVATTPVDVPADVPVGEGEGVLVSGKTESGEDDAPVIVEKPKAVATEAAKTSGKTSDDDDDWAWF